MKYRARFFCDVSRNCEPMETLKILEKNSFSDSLQVQMNFYVIVIFLAVPEILGLVKSKCWNFQVMINVLKLLHTQKMLLKILNFHHLVKSLFQHVLPRKKSLNEKITRFSTFSSFIAAMMWEFLLSSIVSKEVSLTKWNEKLAVVNEVTLE